MKPDLNMHSEFEAEVAGLLHSPYFDADVGDGEITPEEYADWSKRYAALSAERKALRDAAVAGAKSPGDFTPEVRAVYDRAKVAAEEAARRPG